MHVSSDHAAILRVPLKTLMSFSFYYSSFYLSVNLHRFFSFFQAFCLSSFHHSSSVAHCFWRFEFIRWKLYNDEQWLSVNQHAAAALTCTHSHTHTQTQACTWSCKDWTVSHFCKHYDQISLSGIIALFLLFPLLRCRQNSPLFARLNRHSCCVNTQLELNPVGPSCSWYNSVTKMVRVAHDSTNTACLYYPSSQAAEGLLGFCCFITTTTNSVVLPMFIWRQFSWNHVDRISTSSP